jgi:hypothetical protein
MVLSDKRSILKIFFLNEKKILGKIRIGNYSLNCLGEVH